MTRTLAGIIVVQPVAGPAGAVVPVRGVRADLAAASVVLVALLAPAQLPRLVLKVAAVVDEVTDALQRQAGPPVAAVKLSHGVAGEGGRLVLCNRWLCV